MRHRWLLGACRLQRVMECEKGKGDKGWRKQKWEERIIYKNSSLKLLSHWKGKAADQLSFSFCLFLTHKPHTKTHSLSPPHCKTHTYAHTSREEGGWGILLLHSYPVASPPLSSCRFITTNQITENVHLFEATDRGASRSDDVNLTSDPGVYLHHQGFCSVATSSMHQAKQSRLEI